MTSTKFEVIFHKKKSLVNLTSKQNLIFQKPYYREFRTMRRRPMRGPPASTLKIKKKSSKYYCYILLKWPVWNQKCSKCSAINESLYVFFIGLVQKFFSLNWFCPFKNFFFMFARKSNTSIVNASRSYEKNSKWNNVREIINLKSQF